MQGEILEEFMGAIPIYPRGKEKGRALERDHQRESNPSSPMSMRDSACPCKQPPLYGASWWSYTEGTRFFCRSRRREGMSYWTGSFSGIKYHQNCAIAEAMENLPNGQHHRVMYYDS